MQSEVPPVDDGEILLRTDFSPEHVIDGKLVPAAIRSDDLKSRGFSVDREGLADIETIQARASTQMAKEPEKRGEAWISPFVCGPVRNEICPLDEQTAFVIMHKPENDNEAHAMILSAIDRKPSQIKQLKSILLPHLNNALRKLEQYKAERGS